MNFNFVNTTIKNCNYTVGVFYVNYDSNTTFTINNAYFENNYSTNGPIFNVKQVSKDYNDDITINNSIFERNRAKVFGGVIYTSNKFDVLNNDSRISFHNCEFRNNTAKKGIIINEFQ